MKLDEQQERVFRGEEGPGLALAMKTLVTYGQAFGAERLVPIASGHLAGTFRIVSFKAYYKVLGRLASEGVKVKVRTTVNPRPGYDLNLFNKGAFFNQRRHEKDLEALGVTPNYSCACYEEANVPAFGDRLGWAESSAVQYANSVLGARTNRNSVLIDVCSAVTGCTPEFGYLLDENRRGRVLVKLDIDRMNSDALGFVLGQRVADQVPVIEHFEIDRTGLKNLGGAMAASGAVALFHVEGVTPEAPDLKSVFDGEPERTITITQADLDGLRTKNPDSAGLVVFGCPQMTYEELMQKASLFAGKRVKRSTWFCVSPHAKARFEGTPQEEELRRTGVEVHTHCPLAALTLPFGPRPVLTTSGKLYYYLEGSVFGDQDDCLRACGVLA